MSFKLLTEHHLEFISLKGALSKCHIVENLMLQLKKLIHTVFDLIITYYMLCKHTLSTLWVIQLRFFINYTEIIWIVCLFVLILCFIKHVFSHIRMFS